MTKWSNCFHGFFSLQDVTISSPVPLPTPSFGALHRKPTPLELSDEPSAWPLVWQMASTPSTKSSNFSDMSNSNKGSKPAALPSKKIFLVKTSSPRYRTVGIPFQNSTATSRGLWQNSCLCARSNPCISDGWKFRPSNLAPDTGCASHIKCFLTKQHFDLCLAFHDRVAVESLVSSRWHRILRHALQAVAVVRGLLEWGMTRKWFFSSNTKRILWNVFLNLFVKP